MLKLTLYDKIPFLKKTGSMNLLCLALTFSPIICLVFSGNLFHSPDWSSIRFTFLSKTRTSGNEPTLTGSLMVIRTVFGGLGLALYVERQIRTLFPEIFFAWRLIFGLSLLLKRRSSACSSFLLYLKLLKKFRPEFHRCKNHEIIRVLGKYRQGI